MKIKLFIIVIMAFLLPLIWQSNAQAVSSDARSVTRPPSGAESGLYRTPNPIDTSANLVVTGNVAGNRYFRGVVPYQSETASYFRRTLLP